MYRSGAIKATVLAAILAVTAFSSADAAGRSMFMAVNGKTSQPIGHHDFCETHIKDCSIHSVTRVRVKLDAARWRDLNQVNTAVNTGIRPATDEELFGEPEVWTYPDKAGDCEDFVLLKQRKLVEKGWPVGALLITVVRQTNGDGHAVLTVTTDHGDLVLDNLDPDVKLWSDTSYRYLKRQSEYDTGAWMAIEDGRSQPLVGSLR